MPIVYIVTNTSYLPIIQPQESRAAKSPQEIFQSKLMLKQDHSHLNCPKPKFVVNTVDKNYQGQRCHNYFR